MKNLVGAVCALAAITAFACSGPRAQRIDEVNIVPKPKMVDVDTSEGCFELTARTPVNLIGGDSTISYAVNLLNDVLSPSLGTPLKTQMGSDTEPLLGAVNVRIDTVLGPEAYTLAITPDWVCVEAGSSAGAFYAFETLRQMLPDPVLRHEKAGVIELPLVTVIDEPAFAYRGALLDVGRHFVPVDEVKNYIDILAMHKLNHMQWHLTEDQGWRIEIKKYPRLTEVGSIRPRTQLNNFEMENTEPQYEEKPHGGYYTQDQIRDIVNYAQQRFVTVVPEIELPGHAQAALASYPYLGCVGKDYEVSYTWGIHKDVFCAGKDSTFDFLEDVFTEVMELFPSKYIHIGGDECPKDRWKACPLCQKRIKEEGLKNETELQSYFVHRIEDFLRSHGREIIGFDEILEGGLSQTATVMSWRGTKGGIEAAKKGNRVIMAPLEHCYLDYYQTKDPKSEPYYSWGRYLPVEQVYALDPYAGLNDVERTYIWGVQANPWGEYIRSEPDLQFKILPRIGALAEVGWTNGEKNFADFKKRAVSLRRMYEAEGYTYAPYLFAEP